MSHKKRTQRLAEEIGTFIHQYGRQASPGYDPNDRMYDRELERKIKHMDPYELDRLMRGETDDEDEDE